MRLKHWDKGKVNRVVPQFCADLQLGSQSSTDNKWKGYQKKVDFGQ